MTNDQRYEFNFSNKLKLLRETYCLSTTELAHALGFKYNSTISEFERGKNTPSFATLINLANFFGVTIDWLVGRSKILYTLMTIKASENILELNDNNIIRDFPEYVNPTDRVLCYSLSVRANIAVLIRLSESQKHKVTEYRKLKRMEKLDDLLTLHSVKGEPTRNEKPVYDVELNYHNYVHGREAKRLIEF